MKLCLRCNQYFEDGIELCPIDTSQLEAVGDHPLIGALINDRYVVDSVIGKGSTGIVYKATRLLMGTEVAVKVLHSYLGAETGALDRFLREARAASRLRHPHIINIWEFGATDDGQPYFVMDYLEGMTLADLIKQKGALHPMKMMPIIRQVCEALAEAHKQNIIHRDIKPENVVLQETDYAQGQDFVKVLDFGIADQPTGEGGQKRAKMAAGSPAYMSPEQCQGFELDARSDVYSLGIVVYEMLTGERPFAADDVMNLFYQHVSKPPTPMSKVRSDLAQSFTPQLEAAVAKALAKKPQNRQQTIKEFQRELEEACKIAEAGPSKKVDSIKVDLFSVPLGEMLTGESLTTTGSKFLPGPEDWLDQSEPAHRSGADNVSVAPPASPAPAAPVSNNTASASQSGAEQKQEYQAAVDRLLKSAKKASQAAMQTSPAPPPETPEVSNWAREVLTRSDATKSGTDLPGVGSVAEPPKPAETPAKPAEPVKPAAAGAEPTADAKAVPPEAPEVSTWAQRVLSRSSETNMPQIPKPGAPDTPPLPPADAGKKSTPPALPDDDNWNERVNTVDLSIATPADSLRSSTELRSDFFSLEQKLSELPPGKSDAEPSKPAGETVGTAGEKSVTEPAKSASAPLGETAKPGVAAAPKPPIAGQPKPAGAPLAKPGAPVTTDQSVSKTGMPPAGMPAAAPVAGAAKPGVAPTAKPAASANGLSPAAKPAALAGTPLANKPETPSTSASGIPSAPRPAAPGVKPATAAPSTSASGIAAKPAPANATTKPGAPSQPTVPAASASKTGMPQAERPAAPSPTQTGMPSTASTSKTGMSPAKPVSLPFDLSQLDAIKAPKFDASELDAIKAPSASGASNLDAIKAPSASGASQLDAVRPSTFDPSQLDAIKASAPFDASQLDAIKPQSAVDADKLAAEKAQSAFDASLLDAIQAPSGADAAESASQKSGLGKSFLKRGPSASRTGMPAAAGEPGDKASSAFDASQLESIKAPSGFDASQLDSIKAPAKDAVKAPVTFDPSSLDAIKSPSKKPFVQPPVSKEGKPEAPAKPIRPLEKKNPVAQAAERLLGSLPWGAKKDKEKDNKKVPAEQNKNVPPPTPVQTPAPASAQPGMPPGIAAATPADDSPFGGLSQPPASPFGGVPQMPSFDLSKKPEKVAAPSHDDFKPVEPPNHKDDHQKSFGLDKALDQMLEQASVSAEAKPEVVKPDVPKQDFAKLDFSKPSPPKPGTSNSNLTSAIDKMLEEATITPPSKSDYSKPAVPPSKPDVPAKPASPLTPAATHKEPGDFKRFSEPVNKAPEGLNPFANAVESMLDAAILPQRPLDKESPSTLAKPGDKFARSADLLSPFDQKPAAEPAKDASNLTFDPKRLEEAAKAAEPDKGIDAAAQSVSTDAARAAAEARAEIAAAKAKQQAAKSGFDPKRFEEPVNRGTLESSRFDAEVNKALEPFAAAKSGVDPMQVDEMVNKTPTEQKPADQIPAKPALDPSRFDQPVNKGMLQASAIDSAVDRALEPAKDALRSTFDARRFDEPVNKGSLAEPTRFDSAIEKALAQSPKVEPAAPKAETKDAPPVMPRSSNINPFADKPKDTASQEKPVLDPKRFDQPVNKGSESYNPFAQAVDTLLDSAIIKPEAAKPATGATPEPAVSTAKPATPLAGGMPPKKDFVPPLQGQSPFAGMKQDETGLISPAMIKAEQAVQRARTVNQPPAAKPPAAKPPAVPAAPEPVPSTAAGGEQSEDRISEAVTRLIEAAKRAPEPTVATPGKPEALNRKIEAVKRKIEALKSGAAPTADPRAGATAGAEPPVRQLPADPNSLTEAVNKLLEAAQTQSGIYQNVTQPSQAASKKDPSIQNLSALQRGSEAGLPQVPRLQNAAPHDMNNPQFESAAVQSESMSRAHELINQALKAQRTQTEGQDYYSGYRTSDKPITQDRTTRIDQRRKDRARLRQVKSGGGILKVLWMLFLLALVGGALCWTFHIDPKDPMASFHHVPVTFEDFVKAGQYDDALAALDKKAKNPKITPAEQDKLNDQYILLAKKQAGAKKYADAVVTLNRLPKRLTRSKNVDRLIRRYQKAQTQAESAATSSGTATSSGN